MKKLVYLLQFNFLPKNSDAALLGLRLWLGLCMLFLHGIPKLQKFDALSEGFADPFGAGPLISLLLALFGEVVCSVLLILGLFTRFAALVSGTTMVVAFFHVHGGRLTGENNGELAFMYLAGYVALLIAGGGRFALDPKLGAKM